MARLKLVGDGFWTAIAGAGTMALAVLEQGVIVRRLSPNDAGAYFLTLSLVMTAATIGLLGLQKSVIREVADRACNDYSLDNLRPILTKITLLISIASVVAGMALSGVMVLWGWGKHLPPSCMMLLVPLLVLSVAARELAPEVLRALGHVRAGAFVGRFIASALSTLTLLLLFSPDDPTSLASVLEVVAFSSLIVPLLMAIRLWGGKTHSTARPVSARELLTNSFPLLVSLSLIILQSEALLWVLATASTQDEVGRYAVAARMGGLVSFPLLAVNSATSQRLASSLTNNRLDDFQDLLRGGALIATLAALPIFLFLSAAGNGTLTLLYGSIYGAALGPMLIIGLGQLFNVAAGATALALILANRGREITRSVAAGLVLGTAVALALTPAWGATGAAIGSAVSAVATNLLALVYLRTHLGVTSYPSASEGLRILRRLFQQ